MARAYRIEWAPAAIQDLDAIIAFIAAPDGVEAAAPAYSKLRGRIATLDRTPLRCRVVPELRQVGVAEYRELLAGPHRVVIRVTRDVVGVVAVLDGRRDLAELLVNRFVTGR